MPYIRQILTFLIFILIINSSLSQNTDTVAYISVQNYEIEPSSIKKYEITQKSDFEGSYHFGESEGESNLEILYSNYKFYARTEYAEWENNTWVGKSDRLTIRYENEKIIIDKTEYELSILEDTKGLKSTYSEIVDKKNTQFIQFNPAHEIEKPKGKFPETSFVKMTENELSIYSKNELKIMRNEIFARNGYIFKKGGKMDNYFSNKDWYSSINKINNPDLSDIEKYNVDLILKLEQK